MDLVLILIAYLLGSISSAIVVCRLLGLPDPRTRGSRNPGATNVLRIGGKKAAATVLLGDMLKGLLPVLAAQGLGLSPASTALVGVAAFLGHLYPLFFGFQGGKGVATFLGVLLGFSPLLGGAVVATWIAVAILFRYSSLAAIAAALAAPFYAALITPHRSWVIAILVMDLFLIARHRTNIRQLLDGTEDTLTLGRGKGPPRASGP